jgi:hypothetical protein
MTKNIIPLKTMMHYEQATGKNALELLTKIAEGNPSATQLIHMVYLFQLTSNINITIDEVADYDQEKMSAVLAEINATE